MLRRTKAGLAAAAMALAWAMPAAGADEAPPASAWAAAHAEARQELEALKADLEALQRLRAAQKELVDWNAERARLGLSAETLRPELCLEEENKRWCRLFPATFGVGEGRE